MNSSTKDQRFILFIIVVAQFACTSLWFASNAILPDLKIDFNLPDRALGDLTSAVQFGFITGTLVFALLTISDRFSPSKVFFTCALIGSALNFTVVFSTGLYSLFLLRALTGFCLAGIYPVGMKIASDYHEKGLGKALGYLVGALVVGTAFPHLLKTFATSLPWRYVIYAVSAFALTGGIAVLLLVPDGPFRRAGSRVNLSQCFYVFKESKFRSAAFGYFGHMWELYTFWAFVPVLLTIYSQSHSLELNYTFWAFSIIAIGGPACVLGGYLSEKLGSKKTAFVALLISGICCLISPLTFQFPVFVFLLFLLIWGMAVITDSPQFSTLVAQSAPKEATGTALTIVNSIGFAITIVSIQAMNYLMMHYNPQLMFTTLAIGPTLGLLALRKFTE